MVKPLAERERELGDRVRAGLGDVIAGDRHRVEVADLVVDEVLLDVAHHAQREFRARRCRCSAPGLPSGCRPARCRARCCRVSCLILRVGLGIHHLVAGDAKQAQAKPVIAVGQLAGIASGARPWAYSSSICFSAAAQARGSALQVLLDVLVDRGVHEHREDHRRGTVDGHRHRGGRRDRGRSRSTASSCRRATRC